MNIGDVKDGHPYRMSRLLSVVINKNIWQCSMKIADFFRLPRVTDKKTHLPNVIDIRKKVCFKAGSDNGSIIYLAPSPEKSTPIV